MNKLLSQDMKEIRGGEITPGEGSAFVCGLLVVGMIAGGIPGLVTGLIFGPTACGMAIGLSIKEGRAQ